jgi:hypothetical protein
MYTVIMIENNMPVHVRVFSNFDDAQTHADDIVMDNLGVVNDMPNWQEGEYYNGHGITISILPVTAE